MNLLCNKALDFFASFVLGFFTNWLYGKWVKYQTIQELKSLYCNLAGEYANFRVRDGAEEPTGGTIKLTWQSDGSFLAEGLHSNRVVEWTSTIQMSEKLGTGTGEGRYKYVESNDHGIQQITYVREASLFSVMGRSTSRIDITPFLHRWKRTA